MKDTFGIDDAVIPLFYPSSLVRWLESQGYQRSDLLADTGLELAVIDAPNTLINFRQHRRLICNALALTDNPRLGLYFGLQTQITALGIVGYAAISSDTLKQGLETILKYSQLRMPLIRLSLQQRQQTMHLQFDEALDYGPIRAFMMEGIVGASHALLASLGVSALANAEFRLSMSKPAGFEQHQHLLSMPIQFDQPVNEWLFPVELVSQKSMMADPVTSAAARKICDAQLQQLKPQEGIVNRIEIILLRSQGDYPVLSEVASTLCTSPRTLRRELAKLDLSYQLLLDQHRQRLAMTYLQTTDDTLQEIALKLGYNDTTNFGRAFRKWTGRTPGSYRA